MAKAKPKDTKIEVRLPVRLKAAAMAATAEKRGGLSALVRELLAAWLKQRKTGQG